MLSLYITAIFCQCEGQSKTSNMLFQQGQLGFHSNIPLGGICLEPSFFSVVQGNLWDSFINCTHIYYLLRSRHGTIISDIIHAHISLVLLFRWLQPSWGWGGYSGRTQVVAMTSTKTYGLMELGWVGLALRNRETLFQQDQQLRWTWGGKHCVFEEPEEVWQMFRHEGREQRHLRLGVCSWHAAAKFLRNARGFRWSLESKDGPEEFMSQGTWV